MADRIVILGIESSCDETAASVVTNGCAVDSNIIASQADLHEPYGGVVPEIASRAHLEHILPTVSAALQRAGESRSSITAIAVGHRPGLIGSLLVGVTAAKALAWAWNKPIIGIDHIHAHLYAPMLNEPALNGESVYPALGLVVSGGHTDLFVCTSPTNVQRIGHTIDDAIGEAFDKAANILGLGYPGGPVVDRRARRGDDQAHTFPVSRLDADSLNFSFSGLKTSLLYTVRGHPVGRGRDAQYPKDATQLTDAQIDDLCASFERAAVDAVMLKLDRALKQWGSFADAPPRAILVGGGVIANTRLRSAIQSWAQSNTLIAALPHFEFCLDNAAMIAGLAHHRCIAHDFDDLTLSASPVSASPSSSAHSST